MSLESVNCKPKKITCTLCKKRFTTYSKTARFCDKICSSVADRFRCGPNVEVHKYEGERLERWKKIVSAHKKRPLKQHLRDVVTRRGH